MTFDELWVQVKDLPDMAKLQVPDVLTISTKRKIEQKTPEDIEKIVSAAIDEVNSGSVTTLDELIRKRL